MFHYLALFLALCFCGHMQTDYVWDIWDIGFFLNGALLVMRPLRGC